MKKAIEHIKANDLVFANVKHVQCLAHMLHNISDKIRIANPLVDKYIANIKKFLSKSHSRRKDFLDSTKLDNLPPEPVLTRWGTWLVSAEYHLENYDRIREFILGYTPKSDAKSKDELDKLLTKSNVQLKKEFMNLKKYIPLHKLITKLEARNLTIDEQMEIIDKARIEILSSNKELTGYMKQTLETNPDLNTIVSKTNSISFQTNFHYAPLVSVDVERSFSLYKDLLTSKRTCLNETNIGQLLFLKYNRSLCEL